MIIREAKAWPQMAVLMLVLLALAPVGQRSLQADTLDLSDRAIGINRAFLFYDRGEYEKCVGELDRLIEADPQDWPARFLRAVAYGDLAIKRENSARLTRSQVYLMREQAEGIRQQDPEQADDKTRQADELDRRADKLDQQAAEPYRKMNADLDRLIEKGLTDRDAIVRMLNAVVQIKLSRYESREQERYYAEFLERSRDNLDRYLHPSPASGLSEPTGVNRVRGEYFLGVVVYRQALEAPKSGQALQKLADPGKLAEARKIIIPLADPDSQAYVQWMPPETPGRASEVRRWASYANFYLGLIAVREGNYRLAKNNLTAAVASWDQAIEYLDAAVDLDRDEKGQSRSYLIPRVAGPQKEYIEKSKELVKQAPGAAEDVTIEMRTGIAYDTNVILLGGRTNTPLDIGRKYDFRAGQAAAVSYTLDLGKIDPDLSRWTIGLLGRASSNWHSDVSEFNEQGYGGSVALQYDLWPGDDQTGHGPLYASIQYDYDYFLLGNDGFLRSNRISPRLTLYTHDRRRATTLSYSYEDRNYLEVLTDSRFDRDGNYHALGLEHSFDLVDMTEFYTQKGWEPWGRAYDPVDPAELDTENDPVGDSRRYQRWLRPYIGARYEWDSTVGEEFDANQFVFAAGVEVPLPYGLLCTFGSEWEWEHYRHPSRVDFHRRTRRDFIQRYSLGLERRFVLVPGLRKNRTTRTIDRLVMILRAEVLFTDDDSNIGDRLGQQIFEYDRTVYGLSASFLFN